MARREDVFLKSYDMAIVQNPIIGRASGSVGESTLQKWRRLNVLRSKPSVQYNPNTPAQIANRKRFGGCSDFYINSQDVLAPIFRRLAGDVSGFNTYVRDSLYLWDLGSSLMNIEKASGLFLGKGDFAEYQDFQFVSAVGSLWEFDYNLYWPYVNHSYGLFTAVVAYNFDTGESFARQYYNTYGHFFDSTDWVCSAGDRVGAWSVSYSGKYKFFSNTVYRQGVILG